MIFIDIGRCGGPRRTAFPLLSDRVESLPPSLAAASDKFLTYSVYSSGRSSIRLPCLSWHDDSHRLPEGQKFETYHDEAPGCQVVGFGESLSGTVVRASVLLA
jgi:hypothetical protein